MTTPVDDAAGGAPNRLDPPGSLLDDTSVVVNDRPLVFPVDLVELLAVAVDDSVAVVYTDVSGTVVEWSKFAERLYGWTRSEAIGTPITDLTVGPVTAEVADEIMDRLRDGWHWWGRFDARRRDGALFTVDVLDAPVVDADGNVVGLIGLSRESADQFTNTLSELEEFRILVGRLDEFRREEARRIAAQVHDEFSQKLHLAIQQASQLAGDDRLPADARDSLADLVDMQVDLVRVMHGVCGSLRPPLFDELGVVAAIDHLVDATEQRGLSVVSSVDPAVGNVDQSVAEVVLAVTQEALGNVVVHAQAQTVNISATVDEGVVSLTVSDDGVGLSQPWGFGIRLMIERVRRTGGTIKLTAPPDGGSIVAVRLPVSPPPPPVSSP